MHHSLFTFSASSFPEISGEFLEKRVIFNGADTLTQNADTTSAGEDDEKKQTLTEALANTKTTLKSLRNAVDADKNAKTEESEKNDDIDKEKEELATFLAAHKALDNLMGQISGDSKEESLNDYQGYFENGSIDNMTQVEAVHEQITSLIENDVKYVKAKEKEKELKKKVTKAAHKNSAEKFLATLPDAFDNEQNPQKQSEIVSDAIKILNITETFKTPLSKELSYSSTAVVDSLYNKIINSNNYNDVIIEKFKDNENKIAFKKWISNAISSKIDALPDDKKGEKLYVSISFNDEITIKNQADIDQEKEQESALAKELAGENLPNSEKVNAAIQKVKNAKKAFKDKFSGTGSLVAWLFSKFLGVDIKDPLASGGLVSIGRFMAGVDTPEDTSQYDIIKEPTLRKEFLTAQDIQKISIASKITTTDMNTLFASSSAFSSEKVKKSVEKTWDVGGSIGTGPKAKNLMGDVLRKFTGTTITHSSKNTVTFDFHNSTEHLVQASALLQRQPGSLEALDSLASGASDTISGLLGGMDLDIKDMVPQEESSSSPIIGNILEIQEAIGYPDINSVVQNGTKLTVSWDTGLKDTIVDKVRGNTTDKTPANPKKAPSQNA